MHSDKGRLLIPSGALEPSSQALIPGESVHSLEAHELGDGHCHEESCPHQLGEPLMTQGRRQGAGALPLDERNGMSLLFLGPGVGFILGGFKASRQELLLPFLQATFSAFRIRQICCDCGTDNLIKTLETGEARGCSCLFMRRSLTLAAPLEQV
jgi:hypothetical protein